MFLTSGDILNLTLAICLGLLTIFLCWAIYYLVISVHRFYRIVKKVETIVTEAEALVDRVKEKMQGSAAYLFTISEVAKKIFDFVKEKKEERDERAEQAEWNSGDERTEPKKSTAKKIKIKKK
jgi:CHASE3 domain sensor protein